MLPKSVNTVLFYVIPFFLPVLFFGVEAFLGFDQKVEFYSEFGIELVQEALLFVCLFLSLFIFVTIKPSENKWLRIWMGLCSIACFYIAFEEISWGQKFFQWSTPDVWAANATQKETNIHNHSQLFNRVPRTILEIGILFGGIIIPALMTWAPQKLPQKFEAIYPFRSIAVIGILAFMIKVLEQFPGWFDIKIFYRKSEVMEIFMYDFIFLYLVSIAQKWKFEGRLR
ncbi:MAG: hypothetical protein DI586_03110 [Micavibrio aeruginosavorus]|uniref:Uncharacterized protein n=1 Tax=Micavibrio aeruginosavorus TaxID=349221 RepID=A0A2W5FKR4_9BACT|nr:MAG: hypothetical protein DI586_03110 [Micavibrio aeruginosavorus]